METKFLETLTVPQFKQHQGVEKINIVKSPKTGKLFMASATGQVLGAVSNKGLPSNPVVSKITDGTNSLWVLHEASESNNTVATL